MLFVTQLTWLYFFLGQNFNFACPPGHTISKIRGINYNGNKHSGYDKTWSFACKPTAFDLVPLVNCYEKPWIDWSNVDYFQGCPENEVVLGVSSEHNGDDIGYRRWTVKCCSFSTRCRHFDYKWSNWSEQEKDVTYSQDSDWYLVGFITRTLWWRKVNSFLFFTDTFTKRDNVYQYHYARVVSCWYFSCVSELE